VRHDTNTLGLLSLAWACKELVGLNCAYLGRRCNSSWLILVQQGYVKTDLKATTQEKGRCLPKTNMDC